jgi:serine/threonine protein kinase
VKSSGNKRQKRQFDNELEVLKKLDHPNIVRLVDVLVDHNELYLVTEFSSGCELLDEILNRKAFNEQDTFCIVKQILQTLQYCHQYNICHRDIKPENIMLEENL